MAQSYHYQNAVGADTSFDVEQNTVIRIGELGLAADARLASAATSAITIDDPDGSRAYLSHQRWRAEETAGRSAAVLTGTVAKTSGSVTLVGTGSAFLAELQAGDEVTVPGGGGTEYLFVETVTNDTHVDVYSAAAHSASGQTVHRSARKRLWTGSTGDKTIGRGMDRSDGGEIHAAGRSIGLDLVELQALLHTRKITKNITGHVRPAETVGERLTWFLGTSVASDLDIVDDGLVDYPSNPLDKGDVAGQYVDDFLNNLGTVSGRNVAAYYHEATDEIALFHKRPTAFAMPLALRLSNVDADEDATTLIVDATPEAKLVESGQAIASRIEVTYARSSVIRERDATVDTFGVIDADSPSNQIKTLAKAQAYGDRDLADNANEVDSITCSVTVPAAIAAQFRPLACLQVKFSHFDRWQDFAWARIWHLDIHDAVGVNGPIPGFYTVGLTLSPVFGPNIAGPVQTATERHQDDITFASPTTPGHLLVYLATWRQLLTSPAPPADGETWTLLGEAPFVDDHDSPDPCMITAYACKATISQASHTKANAVGGSSNGTIIHSVMKEYAGLEISDLVTIVSGPNAPGNVFDIGSLGDVVMAFGAWGNGWDGFSVDPTGIETATLTAGWSLDFHASRDQDATTLAAFVDGFACTVYASALSATSLEAQISMVNSAGTPMHWGGVAVGVRA